jgi:hypothetical protein
MRFDSISISIRFGLRSSCWWWQPHVCVVFPLFCSIVSKRQDCLEFLVGQYVSCCPQYLRCETIHIRCVISRAFYGSYQVLAIQPCHVLLVSPLYLLLLFIPSHCHCCYCERRRRYHCLTCCGGVPTMCVCGCLFEVVCLLFNNAYCMDWRSSFIDSY